MKHLGPKLLIGGTLFMLSPIIFKLVSLPFTDDGVGGFGGALLFTIPVGVPIAAFGLTMILIQASQKIDGMTHIDDERVIR